jgi:AcrR family transcriptional regulator
MALFLHDSCVSGEQVPTTGGRDTTDDETSPAAPGARLRADARRNRERILIAARDMIIEQGPAVPLDAIATRAGVGNATLYRRFPDREALMRAVAIDVLARAAAEARSAMAEEADAFRALARYMHRALDSRVAAVMSTVADETGTDGEVLRLRNETAGAQQRIIETAQEQGLLRPDVSFGDIGLLLLRLSRPLPAPIPREMNDALGHRHLDFVLAGLRTSPEIGDARVSGPALSLGDLRSMPDRRGDEGDDHGTTDR